MSDATTEITPSHEGSRRYQRQRRAKNAEEAYAFHRS
jgi:hypothetical protein